MSASDCSSYKDYIHRLRSMELEEVHLQVVTDTSPELKTLLKRILNTEFRDGLIHSYYGKIKYNISAFNNFWSEIIDESIVNTDKYTQLGKDDALSFIEKSILQQVTKQVDFGKEYIPVKTDDEKQLYESLDAKYQIYMKELYKLKEDVREISPLYFPAVVVTDKFKTATQKLGEMFDFTKEYIALILADNLYRIRSSLEERAVRARSSLRSLRAARDCAARALVLELYERNQDLKELQRREPANELTLAEMKQQVSRASQRLEAHRLHEGRSIALATEDLRTWTERIRDFEAIAQVLRALKAELQYTREQETTYGKKRCLELPGTKKEAWELIGVNIQKRKEYLNIRILDAAKTLMTFFNIQGSNVNVELHQDPEVRPYFHEFGHQVCRLQHGLNPCHVTCSVDPLEISFDCGLSKDMDAHCPTEMRQASRSRSKADTAPEHLGCKDKLDPETTKYIWDTFGHILPEALAAVADVKPENPLKYLGNRLLKLQRSWSKTEIKKRREASARFREDILGGRKEKLTAATLAWRARLRARGKRACACADDETAAPASAARALGWWHLDTL